MSKVITVKGIGNVSAKVDYVVLTLKISAQNIKYNAAMEEAADRIALLERAVEQIGFKKDDLKTIYFHVRTQHKDVRTDAGEFQQVFLGYTCDYKIKFAFDFDSERLSTVLSAVADSGANAELNMTFTVKNPGEISEELLFSAAENARKKAEILCRAAGVELGELLSIDYNWGELKVESKTDYMMLESIFQKKSSAPTIRPDDINLRDTAAFIWEIK